jgi:hypothetical protein
VWIGRTPSAFDLSGLLLSDAAVFELELINIEDKLIKRWVGLIPWGKNLPQE